MNRHAETPGKAIYTRVTFYTKDRTSAQRRIRNSLIIMTL